MHRNEVFLEMIKALISNPNIVNNLSSVNNLYTRNQIIDRSKELTNLVMSEIEYEDDLPL